MKLLAHQCGNETSNSQIQGNNKQISKLHRKTIVSALENLKFLLFGDPDVSIDHYALLSS
jgi:hypothetical protein